MSRQGKTITFAQRIVDLINSGEENILIGSQGKTYEVAVIVRCANCKHYHKGFNCDLLIKPFDSDESFHCMKGEMKIEADT